MFRKYYMLTIEQEGHRKNVFINKSLSEYVHNAQKYDLDIVVLNAIQITRREYLKSKK